MVLKMIQNTKRKERNMIFSDFYDKDMKKQKRKQSVGLILNFCDICGPHLALQMNNKLKKSQCDLIISEVAF